MATLTERITASLAAVQKVELFAILGAASP
ncbi:hypothetical protein EES37_37080 [Streptomyces sp. ADI91-18]|nr:hypothetical protein EES37_37080 [Streptomyces sp. ADI91-18]